VTGVALAGLLDMPSVAVVTKIESRRQGHAQREVEGGPVDVVEVDTPAVLDHPDRDQRAALRDSGRSNRRRRRRSTRQAVELGEPAARVRKMSPSPGRAKAQRC
jgi:electron transfer flavoprotein alpha/beta subunit